MACLDRANTSSRPSISRPSGRACTHDESMRNYNRCRTSSSVFARARRTVSHAMNHQGSQVVSKMSDCYCQNQLCSCWSTGCQPLFTARHEALFVKLHHPLVWWGPGASEGPGNPLVQPPVDACPCLFQTQHCSVWVSLWPLTRLRGIKFLILCWSCDGLFRCSGNSMQLLAPRTTVSLRCTSLIGSLCLKNDPPPPPPQFGILDPGSVSLVSPLFLRLQSLCLWLS